MRKLSYRKTSSTPYIASTPQGDGWHQDIMAYLGSMNTGYVVLAAFRLYALSKLSTESLENSGSGSVDGFGVRKCKSSYLELHCEPKERQVDYGYWSR